jgi:hypothetical protein
MGVVLGAGNTVYTVQSPPQRYNSTPIKNPTGQTRSMGLPDSHQKLGQESEYGNLQSHQAKQKQ